jgi:hypothetical protein
MVVPGLRCRIPMTASLAGRGRQESTVTSLVTRSVRDSAYARLPLRGQTRTEPGLRLAPEVIVRHPGADCPFHEHAEVSA